MVDERLLRRLDWLLTALTVWLLLSLVLAGFALMVLDTAIGLLALTTVVLVSVVTGLSYLRSSGTPDVEVSVR
jgi:membrane-bound ClpP family serine protease